MDIDAYFVRVLALIESIKKHVDPRSDLFIRQFSTAFGTVATELQGTLKAPVGYTLDVRRELMRIELNGGLHREYRYTIYKADRQLIRFQTDLRYPANAHFPPNYLTEHFIIERWPPDLQELNFEVVYNLFTKIIRNKGELPEPFKSA